ncbi:MAG: LLM class flavin-dependent oxidoreductase [SAR202 cluster bacterium]|nr:LLM class flavin-dependent oxidoreductase [SAR202 cluster bacterium]
MALRIGTGLFGWPFGDRGPEALWEYVDAAEALAIDSVWLTDRIVSNDLNLEPVTALSFIAARTKKLKFGTSVLALPLRNPTVLAKELATLDWLSGGRCLPAIGLGTEDDREYVACGVSKAERAGRTDEAIEVMRRLWTEDAVTHRGRYFTLEGISIQPKPAQKALPIWIGGRTEAAMRRLARLGDGWLVSQATPAEVRHGIARVNAMATEYGRAVEQDHFGVLFTYCVAASRDEARHIAEPHLRFRRTDVDPSETAIFGTPEDLVARIREYVAAGATKFVARAACPPERMAEQLRLLGEEVLPMFHKG